jgi:hypothetical protein
MNNDFWQWIAVYPDNKDTTMQTYHRKPERYWTTAHVIIEMLIDLLLLVLVCLGVAFGLILFS